MKIFTLPNCTYCTKLKGMLDADGYEYTELNVDDPKVEEEFNKIAAITHSYDVPTVVVGKHLLIPGKSFNTIEDCYKIILTFI